MGIIGDFKKMKAMRSKIKGLTDTAQRTKLMKQVAATALSQVALGFRGQKDPYDNPWEKLRYRKGRILQDTARLKASFVGTPKPDGFTIGTNVEYAEPHQEGFRTRRNKKKRTAGHKIKPRRMVPVKSKGLGKRWNKAIAATVNRAVKAIQSGE